MRFLLALVLALGAAESARASCIAASSRCPCLNADGLLEATVAVVDGPRVTLRVSAVHGKVGSHAIDGTLELPRAPDERVGSRTLVAVWDGSYSGRIPVGADGAITCPLAEPDFSAPVATLIPMILAPEYECARRVYDAGFQEPPCNDTGYACTGLPAGAVALVALAAALRAVRRRSSSR